MTLSALLYYGKNKLIDAGCENAYFDSICILESITGLKKTRIMLSGDDELSNDKTDKYKILIERRTHGEPLQYLLGKWEFMGLEMFVGPGVLIPRRETEGLVEIAIAEINRMNEPIVFDLCAGTGCVGISVAKFCPGAKVFLIENSADALVYMKQNIQNHTGWNTTTAVYGDVNKGYRSFDLPKPDFILSNPPYVPTCELDNLQKEVLYEPKIALDGGSDGMDFYRTINDKWLPHLNRCGVMAVECGDDQADRISSIFAKYNQKIHFSYDANNFKRIVVIKK